MHPSLQCSPAVVAPSIPETPTTNDDRMHPQGTAASGNGTARGRRRALQQATLDQVTVYYDVGGVPASQATAAANSLAAAATLQRFRSMLQQAGELGAVHSAGHRTPCHLLRATVAVNALTVLEYVPSLICELHISHL